MLHLHSICWTDGINCVFLSFWLFQDLDSSLETLTAAFERATAEKLRFQEEVNRTNKTIELANRLVKGLEVSAPAAAAAAAGFVDTEQTSSSSWNVCTLCVFSRVRMCAGPILWLSTMNRKKP